MREILRNSEIKVTLRRFIIIQLVFLVGFGTYQYFMLNRVKMGVIDSQAGLLSRLIYKHPELENDIIGSITKGVGAADIVQGKAILNSYGYTDKIALEDEPIMNKYRVINNFNYVMLITLYTLSIGALIVVGYTQIYKKVNNINRSLEEILRENFTALLPEGEEGEFSILGHHFNNMSRMINQNIELLKQERTFLRDIISDISHQLKTPMSSLIILNDLMLEEKAMEEETRQDFLDKSRVQLSKMSWLIKSLLKLARLEGRAVIFNCKETPLINVVEGAIATLKIPAEQKNIKISLVDEKGTSFVCDREWTMEAIINILKNCIEHTPQNGEINISIDGSPISSIIKIQDRGEGIADKDLPHVFERFYKGSNSTKEDSIGIGLALSKSIIEGQGGEIKARSVLNKGTEFIITFLRGVI